jgi:hypothetical protein
MSRGRTIRIAGSKSSIRSLFLVIPILVESGAGTDHCSARPPTGRAPAASRPPSVLHGSTGERTGQQWTAKENQIGRDSLKVTRLNYRPSPCPECKQPVPTDANICPNCKSYQNWRRYVAVGQTNLALLVALFSVLTTLFSVGLPLIRSRGADIRFLLESVSGNQPTFIVRNDGRSGGVVHIDLFSIEVGDQHLGFPLPHEGLFIEAGKEQRVVVDVTKNMLVDVCTLLSDSKFFDSYGKIEKLDYHFGEFEGSLRTDERFYKMQGALVCKFSGVQTSFYEPSSRKQITLPCSSIGWVTACLRRANNSFIDAEKKK